VNQQAQPVTSFMRGCLVDINILVVRFFFSALNTSSHFLLASLFLERSQLLILGGLFYICSYFSLVALKVFSLSLSLNISIIKYLIVSYLEYVVLFECIDYCFSLNLRSYWPILKFFYPFFLFFPSSSPVPLMVFHFSFTYRSFFFILHLSEFWIA
jgi:hypothetical protein